MCYCDAESPSFYRVSNPVARTAHRCCECRRTIRPGERYESASGLWDGSFGNYATCSNCLALRAHMIATAECFCLFHTTLLGDVREEISNWGRADWWKAARLYAATQRARKAEAQEPR